MATATSTGSGRWSAAIWSGGAGAGGAPADGDSVTIAAGHSVLMDTDLSAWTGVVTLTVTGGVTPGMLYWCDQTAGLGIGTTKPNVATTQFGYLIGTTFYEKAAVAAGTALSGDDVPQGKYGAWALDIGTNGTIDITAASANGTGYDSAVLAVAGLPAVEASHSRVGYVTASKSDAVFDPGTTDLDAANTTVAYTSLTGTTAGFNRGHLKIRTAGSLVGTTDTNRGRLLANSNGTWGGTTAMAYANKAVIDMNGTALITATNLDIATYGTNPSATSVRTYGQVFAECTVAADPTNTLTYTGIAAALPNNTLVRVTAGSGALPTGLSAGTDYWVVSASGNTIKLATSSGGSAIALGSGGPINVHSGFYGNWGVSGNTLTKTTHGLANGTAVMVKSTGTLPTPLLANEMYYVVSTAAGAISLSYTSGGSTITLGGSPSGTLDVYTGSTGAAPGTGGTNPYTSTIVNVLDDVTADTGWSTATGQNRVVLADEGPADYDQQRLTVSTITATTMTLSAVVDSIQYPNARIWLSSRNVSIRSAGTSSSQSIVDYSSATTLSGVFQCEIVNTGGSGTTFYGYGINNGTGHTISGSISGCSYGINTGTSHTVSGSISGCSYGIYSGTSHTISGSISGCYSGSYSGTSHTISGSINGGTYGINTGISHTISGSINGGTYGIYSGTSHTISGSISGCTYGIYSGTSYTISGSISRCTYGIGGGGGAHIVSGTITDCGYHFRIDNGLAPTIIKHSSTTSALVFYNRNTSYTPARIPVEDSNGTLNAQKIHDMFGDILKTACDGAGNAPSVDPDAGNGNCIEVSNVQSNIATLGMKIFEHRVWAAASTSKTYTYKMQTRYTGLETADRIKLVASYLSAGSGVTRSTVTDNTGPATRSDDTDWAKTMAVTVNPSQTGWVIITLTLYYYESGNEIYIWPNPAIT